MIQNGFANEDTAQVKKKKKGRSLKTSQTCGETDIPNSKSHFYHTPNAQARNYGKMHGSDPFFQKMNMDFLVLANAECAHFVANHTILKHFTLEWLECPRRYIRLDRCFGHCFW